MIMLKSQNKGSWVIYCPYLFFFSFLFFAFPPTFVKLALLVSPFQKLIPKVNLEVAGPNCDRIISVVAAETDLIWMVTLPTSESRTHYNNKE